MLFVYAGSGNTHTDRYGPQFILDLFLMALLQAQADSRMACGV
jgi:hypothetical protein